MPQGGIIMGMETQTRIDGYLYINGDRQEVHAVLPDTEGGTILSGGLSLTGNQYLNIFHSEGKTRVSKSNYWMANALLGNGEEKILNGSEGTYIGGLYTGVKVQRVEIEQS